MPTVTQPYLKNGHSIDRKIVDKAKHSPDEMIQYIESLPEGIRDSNDPSNLITYLYQTALKARTVLNPL